MAGFLGGFESPTDQQRSVRRIAMKLNEMPGVAAQPFRNQQRKLALRWIRKSLICQGLDQNHNGRLDPAEAAQARVVLYGQSWGGDAAVRAARELGRLGIPVLLTVQVDSVGLRDNLIPPNVHAAVNFYQHDPLTIQGEPHVRAEDPARTTILGNFEASYPVGPSRLGQSRQGDAVEVKGSWARKVLGGGHARMEQDPAVWQQVERFIVDAIQKP